MTDCLSFCSHSFDEDLASFGASRHALAKNHGSYAWGGQAQQE